MIKKEHAGIKGKLQFIYCGNFDDLLKSLKVNARIERFKFPGAFIAKRLRWRML
jgi:hypothetical protein